ncbi:hypothetical protein CONPUDRAFT_88282 [Coniophora puteana RWD-64-598 SS2]|uniref:Uncharacterized protein n=1 Tax=Coniophora puteana (strain RWD-64-598) TaxID=741705 RepID=A0A5M3MXP6_CONPW|nr:uncharacterized protein CONPUDRAFT_88282 [Coniophora puteana RWD-64-598 SS2]EIW83888.1 hypothetical protein CONPUDRAFT_88282 [Coniophora puteana RWD-64-598 SS2]
MVRKRDDGPTCRDDPAGYALSCLPYADDDHDCADSDLRCLCKLLTTNGNSDIANGRCVSDGCINGPGAGGQSGYSSASAYQASFCSSVIATPLGSIVTPSPTSTSAATSSPTSGGNSSGASRLGFEQGAPVILTGMFTLSLPIILGII